MKFLSCTSRADNSLFELSRTLSVSSDPLILLLQKKIHYCDCHVLLVTDDRKDLDRLDVGIYDKKLLENLFDAWRIIVQGNTNTSTKETAYSVINQIGDVVQFDLNNRCSTSLRKIKKSDLGIHYFFLLSGKDIHGLPLYKLTLLCNLWQIEQKRIPLHAAGVVHQGDLYLFSGPSGAGKSTISNLSMERGDWVLDEDQVLLKPQVTGGYCAQAWGYSLVTSDAPLRAIFKLVQDTADQLIPLSKQQTARFLVERNLDVIGHIPVTADVERVYRSVSNVARVVPGFELHFRKSTDFWRLIDAEFGLE
jgi:hypothetical protein